MGHVPVAAGVLRENAIRLVAALIPPPSDEQLQMALQVLHSWE